jgi:hypothetical protein
LTCWTGRICAGADGFRKTERIREDIDPYFFISLLVFRRSNRGVASIWAPGERTMLANLVSNSGIAIGGGVAGGNLFLRFLKGVNMSEALWRIFWAWASLNAGVYKTAAFGGMFSRLMRVKAIGGQVRSIVSVTSKSVILVMVSSSGGGKGGGR